jgi:hypothetical protein
MMKQIEDHETMTKTMMTETETQTRIKMRKTQLETTTTKTEMKTTAQMMKQGRSTEEFIQSVSLWMAWLGRGVQNSSILLLAGSLPRLEEGGLLPGPGTMLSRLFLKRTTLRCIHTSPIPCDELPPAPPPSLYEEDDDEVPDDESNYDDTDDDDDNNDDDDGDLLALEYYEFEAATKGPPTNLLRYVERCHATCSTPELHSAMDSILQTKIQQTLVEGQLYTFDWDNQPLMISTTDETAPQHEAPPTLTCPCSHIVNYTSEVDNNMDKSNALPADINPNTNPWDVTETYANLVPDLASDSISNSKRTTVADTLLPLPSDGTEPAAYLLKLPSYSTEHVVDTHPLITLDPRGAWHKPIRTPSPDTMELAWHQLPKQKMKSKKKMMNSSGKHSSLGCQSPHFQVFHLLLHLLHSLPFPGPLGAFTCRP